MQWVVHAHELEDTLVKAVLSVRGSDDYEAQIKDLILARDNHCRAADDAVRRAEEEVRRIEKELASLVKGISFTAGHDATLKERLDEEIKPFKQSLTEAQADLESGFSTCSSSWSRSPARSG